MLAGIGYCDCFDRSRSLEESEMRVRIVSKPTTDCIDGIQLRQFHLGVEYELGSRLAELMIVEGWAQPVLESPSVSSAAPAPSSEGRERRTNILRVGRPTQP
jgi:hypothetical protein